METLKTPIPLPLAFVPAASPEDGLIKTAELEQPIIVNVEVWEAAEPHYYAQLVLNDQLVGSVRTITEEDQPGSVLVFELSESLFKSEGNYNLAYRASSPFSELHVISEPIKLRIDRTPPGAGLISPLIFPDVTLGQRLIAQLPSYSGMQTGDLIQSVCNGMKGPSHTVVAEELIDTPITIIFEREFLQSLGSSSVLIEYFITDRAGNVSIMSLPVTLTIQA
jgi:hypothetical protein